VTSPESESGPPPAGLLYPVERLAAVLRPHDIEAIVVETGAKAREVVLPR